MKKILTVLILLLLQNNLSFSKEFEWSKVAVNKNGDKEFYLDFLSLREIDNYNYQWILINYLDDSNDYKSEIAYATVDCEKKKIQEIILTQYSKEFAKGETQFHELLTGELLEWLDFPSNSVGGMIIESSCNLKASSIKSQEPRKEKDEKKKKKSKYKEF